MNVSKKVSPECFKVNKTFIHNKQFVVRLTNSRLVITSTENPGFNSCSCQSKQLHFKNKVFQCYGTCIMKQYVV